MSSRNTSPATSTRCTSPRVRWTQRTGRRRTDRTRGVAELARSARVARARSRAMPLPDAAMLPSVQGEATLLFDGGRVLVVRSISLPRSRPTRSSSCSNRSRRKSEATGIRFVAVNGRVPELMRAEVAQATEHLGRMDRHRKRRYGAGASGRGVSRQARSDQPAARHIGAAETGKRRLVAVARRSSARRRLDPRDGRERDSSRHLGVASRNRADRRNRSVVSVVFPQGSAHSGSVQADECAYRWSRRERIDVPVVAEC